MLVLHHMLHKECQLMHQLLQLNLLFIAAINSSSSSLIRLTLNSLILSVLNAGLCLTSWPKVFKSTYFFKICHFAPVSYVILIYKCL